jgi:hypothetical protein
MNALLNKLFGCVHRKTTFPMTAGRNLDRTYVVCLDCGTEFRYDWKRMRRGEPIKARSEPAVVVAPVSAPGFLRRFSA